MPSDAAQGGGGHGPVLVTGGAGFVGSHLVTRLLEAGERVTVIDDLTTGTIENLPDHEGLEFSRGTVSEILPGMASEGRTFSRVFHFAASVGVALVMDDPAAAIENNVHETAVTLRTLAAMGAPPTLIASSSEVYGKPEAELFAEDDDSVYGPTTSARWSYAAGKALDEHLALAHHNAGRLPVVIARLFNTVGPHQTGRYGMVLPRFVEAAMRGDDLPVHGDGSQSRCFCDARDVAGGLHRLLTNTSSLGRVFNIGSDTPVTILELARMVIDTLGSNSGVRFVPYDEAFGPGFEDLKRRRPDLSRIRSAIGFEPAIALRQTILDIAEDIRSREAGARERSA
ncbi:MAG: NAD-dependent epimerase/dehydratase family protein [Planctomycetota bacterium]